jgi:PEP-CTERM motif
MKFKKIALLAAMLAAGAAQAATVSYSSNVVALTTTNFSDTLSFSKFDPLLGTLLSATVTLNGNVLGDGSAESLDSAPATITLNLKATETYTILGLSSPLVAIPVVSTSFNATAFDGSVDFGGTSGVSLKNLSATGSDADTFTSVADLAIFTGVGMLSGGLQADGASVGTGSGNLITLFRTQAGATASVVYEYTPAVVPEPETYALMLAGLAVVGAMARRRRV